VLGGDELEVEEALVMDMLVSVWVFGSASCTSSRRCHSIPRSSNHSGRGLILALGTSGAAAAVVDADVEGEVAAVLDRGNGLTLGLEAGFLDGVVEMRQRT
jgi:hypothetical protein